MSYEIEKIKLKTGRTVIISQDDLTESPREWDKLTTMVCFHSRYNLGDDHDIDHNDYNGWDEMEEAIMRDEKPLVIEPLYLYDHSGITISTEPFGCRWDSGQIGFVYITQENIDSYGLVIGGEETWNDYLQRLSLRLKNEVKIYDDYICGNVYYYQIEDENGEVVDSCGGFYGDLNKSGMLEYLREYLTAEEVAELMEERSYV